MRETATATVPVAAECAGFSSFNFNLKLVAGAAKAITELGWKPKFPKLEDIVSTAWRWHRQHPHGYTD